MQTLDLGFGADVGLGLGGGDEPRLGTGKEATWDEKVRAGVK